MDEQAFRPQWQFKFQAHFDKWFGLPQCLKTYHLPLYNIKKDMLLTGPFAMLFMPSFDFHLPPCMEGFLIHLSPLWQLPLWQLPLFPLVEQFPCVCLIIWYQLGAVNVGSKFATDRRINCKELWSNLERGCFDTKICKMSMKWHHYLIGIALTHCLGQQKSVFCASFRMFSVLFCDIFNKLYFCIHTCNFMLILW